MTKGAARAVLIKDKETSMNAPEPTTTVNLDRYGAAPLEWSRVRDRLDALSPSEDLPCFFATTNPDGTPHVVGVGALWLDGTYYVVSGPGTRKSRNLAANPACALALRLPGIDLTFEGNAERVTDFATLDRVAATYRSGGWPAEVEGDAFTAPFSAPSAGPAPWHLYRIALRSVHAVASEEPNGATRWRFDG